MVSTVRGAEPRPAGLGRDRNGFSWVLGGSTLAHWGEEGVQGIRLGFICAIYAFPFGQGNISRITHFWKWGIRSVFGNRKTEFEHCGKKK